MVKTEVDMNLIRLIFLSILFSILIFCAGVTHPVIIIQTELGEIEVEIYHDRAPVTSANFLRYVDAGIFENASFYRTVTPDNDTNSVPIDVIQGGKRYNEDMREKGFPAIKHETTTVTKILHTDGAISMARSDVGTAASEFFICIGNQPELDRGGNRNTDGQGFSAFGYVIKGMDVVRNIHSQPAKGQRLTPRIGIINIIRKN